MQRRLTWLLSAAALVYAGASTLNLWLQYQPTLPQAAANLLLGALTGVLFVFFSGGERLSPSESLLSLSLNALVGMVLFGVFALLAERGADWRPALAVLPRGAAFGALMWGLGTATGAVASPARWAQLVGVLASVAVIISAPWVSVQLFGGGSLLVVAVAARVVGTAALRPLSLARQAWVFGVVIGMLIIALPSIGWFAGGYY